MSAPPAAVYTHFLNIFKECPRKLCQGTSVKTVSQKNSRVFFFINPLMCRGEQERRLGTLHTFQEDSSENTSFGLAHAVAQEAVDCIAQPVEKGKTHAFDASDLIQAAALCLVAMFLNRGSTEFLVFDGAVSGVR